MTIEAELKALLRDPPGVRDILANWAAPDHSSYHDRYYDRPDRGLTSTDHELRVRTITSEGTVRTVLTYKEPAVDEVSRSKPEHETEVAGAQVLHAILTGLGLTELISFRKECVNYRFQRRGRDFLATVVTVPELGDTTFIEIETIVEPADLDDALLAARDVLAELGIVDDDLTSQTYTDAVAEARRSPERSAKTITAR